LEKIIVSEFASDFDASSKILDLWHKLKEKAEREYRLVADKAIRNEQFFDGDQGYTQQLMSAQNSAFGLTRSHPMTTTNYIRNVVNQYKARLTKDRPSVTAWPTHPDAKSRAASAICRSIIEYTEAEIQFDKLLNEVVQHAALHGTAGFKIVFEPSEQKILWQKLSIFDYLIDPAQESYEAAKWVAFKAYLDEDEALTLLENAGVKDASVGAETYRPYATGPARDGVVVWELWHKPSPSVPEGLYCKIIDDNVIDVMPFPYIVKNLETLKDEYILPIVLMKIDDKRNCPYGTTWVEDCIQPQIQVNEIQSTLLTIRRATQGVRLIVGSDEIAQEIMSSNSILVNPSNLPNPTWTPAPQINPLLFSDQEKYRSEIYDLAGLNEQLMGVSSFRSGTAAKQLAYLNELDNLKHKGAAENMNSMIIRAWKLHLQLVQNYYTVEQTIAISDASQPQIISFIGSDIQGINVKLEPRGGMERFSATKEAQIELDAQQGLIDPARVLDARETGFSDTANESTTAKLVLAQIDGVLQGAEVAADAQLDADEASKTIQSVLDALLANGADRYSLDPLYRFKKSYDDLANPPQMADESVPAGNLPQIQKMIQ